MMICLVTCKNSLSYIAIHFRMRNHFLKITRFLFFYIYIYKLFDDTVLRKLCPCLVKIIENWNTFCYKNLPLDLNFNSYYFLFLFLKLPSNHRINVCWFDIDYVWFLVFEKNQWAHQNFIGRRIFLSIKFDVIIINHHFTSTVHEGDC